MYLSHPEYNDLDVPINEEAYQTLRANGKGLIVHSLLVILLSGV
jgi:hypothetical protein